jgi:hypothetical protein
MAEQKTMQAWVTSTAPLQVTVAGADTPAPAELSGPYPQSVTNDDNGTLEDVSGITGIASDAMTANTIYASVVNVTTGVWRVDLYKNSKRTVKIGYTDDFSADLAVAVQPSGGYALGGSILIGNFATIAADSNIHIAVVQYKPALNDHVEIIDRSPQMPLVRGKTS